MQPTGVHLGRLNPDAMAFHARKPTGSDDQLCNATTEVEFATDSGAVSSKTGDSG